MQQLEDLLTHYRLDLTKPFPYGTVPRLARDMNLRPNSVRVYIAEIRRFRKCLQSQNTEFTLEDRLRQVRSLGVDHKRRLNAADYKEIAKRVGTTHKNAANYVAELRKRDCVRVEGSRSDIGEFERRLGSYINSRRITQREQEVLDLLVVGMTRKEIGERLGIHEGTVKRHFLNLGRKMLDGSVNSVMLALKWYELTRFIRVPVRMVRADDCEAFGAYVPEEW
jgi:DNA-binding CsgD family transcriptional regulator